MKPLQANHGMGHALFCTGGSSMHGTDSTIAQGLLSPVDLSLLLPRVDVFHLGGLFDLEQLVSLDHHPAHFKGPEVLLESDC